MKARSTQKNNRMSSSSSSESQSESGERSKDARDSHQEGVDQSALEGAFDVITVHGLHVDSPSTWEARDSELGLEGITTLENLCKGRFLHYTYNKSGAFSGNDIILEASKLLHYISNARRGLNPDAHRPIALVSHGIGGAIVKRALYFASTDPEYATVAHSTRLLIFFGYPHRCQNLQQMTNAVARDVLPKSDYASLSTSFFEMIGLAQAIIDCNDVFVEAKFMLRAKLINIYSSKANPGEYVFDEWMATTDSTGEVKISSPETHANLACPSAERDFWWSIFKAVASSDIDPNKGHAMEDNQSREWSVFSSVPLYLQSRARLSPQRTSWLMDHENFKTWQNNYHSSGVVVQTSDSSDAISESIFEAITEAKVENSIYFSFDCHDNRRSNMRTFLDGSMAQWTQNRPSALREDVGYPHLIHYRSFTESDALYTWTTMLTCIIRTTTFFVLNNVDESEDMKPSFWEHLACFFKNQDSGPCKFILFAKPGHQMHETLSHWPKINMDNQEIRPGMGHDVEQEISCHHTQLLCSRYLPIPGRLLDASICKGNWKDVGLTPFMRGQSLRVVRRPTGTSFEAFIQRLPYVSPEELAEETMSEVPEKFRTFVSDILSWIVCAVRPLSLDELESTSTLTIGESPFNQSIDLASALDELLPGMLDFSNRRVRFSHHRLHKFFERAEDVWFAIRHTAHGLITRICLDTLRLTRSLDALLGLCNTQYGIWATPVFKPQNNLTSYAVEYWPRHYSLASDRPSLLKLVMDFFQSGSMVRKWEGARWMITNPFTRTDRSYLKSLLPLAASTGLCDVFHQQFESEKQNSASEAVSNLPFALAEALRNGHTELANSILLSVNLKDPQAAELVLLAAVSYGGNEDLQISLADHVSDQHLENFSWPDPLIFRASWLGQARLVKKLIQCNASIKVRGEYYDRPNVLQAALLNGHLEVAQMLLDKDASLVQEIDDAGRTALGYAAMNMRPEVVNFLLRKGTDVHARHGRTVAPVTAACSGGNHAVLRVLLENGAETEPLGEKITPLAVAASRGFVKCVQALLEEPWKANVNGEGEYGPAIVESAREGHFDVVQLLVKRGAAVNARTDENSWNAIIAAVSYNKNVEMVKYLLQHDADIGSKCGDTLVGLAASGSNVEILRVLLQADADLSTTTDLGWAPIHEACSKPANIRPLAEADRACVDQVSDNESGWYPLSVAVSKDKIDAVEILLEYKANPDRLFRSRDGEGQYSALHMATETFNIDIARKLLEAGADVNLKTVPDGYTALHHAVYNEEFLKMLLEFEPDVNLTDNEDNTVLNHYLIYGGEKLSIVKMLVHGGANINKANKDGMTPLHRAAIQESPHVVRFLLQLGANANAVCEELGAPLNLACWLGTPETVKLLVKANADVMRMHPKSGHSACEACYRMLRINDYERVQKETSDILRYLLHESDKTVDVNRVGGDYGCILGTVCFYCSAEIIDIVLSAKANVNLQATLGRHPIHFAAYSTVENLRRLKEAGAKLNARDNMGRTILHCAVQGGNVDLVKYVIQETEGLLHMADNDGWTPLHYAARGCNAMGREMRIERLGQSAGEEQFQIVSHLVEKGSNITACSNGPNRRWTPAMLAQFHGARQDTQDLLMPRNSVYETNESRPDDSQKIGRAHAKDTYCDCCFVATEGLNYKCKLCNNVDLCYKCYPIREYSQHRDHEWEEIGPEYRPDDEAGSASASVSESESDT